MNRVTDRDATPADAEALAAFFRASFTETFGHLYAPADLAAFLAQATKAAMGAELRDPAFTVRIAEEGDRVAGFAKLGPPSLPIGPVPRPVELRQLYVGSAWHGRGVASTLMDWVLGEARRRDASDLILSVYIDNHRARRFYDRYGFVDVGRYDFPVGAHIDEDVVMRLEL